MHLTDKAYKIGSKLEQVYEGVFSAAARGIPEEEIKGFIKLSRRISENLSKNRKGKKGAGIDYE